MRCIGPSWHVLRECSAVWLTHLVAVQTKNAFEVKADLPGVDKKDIKVNVEGDVLTISHDRSAEKREKKEENGIKYHV